MGSTGQTFPTPAVSLTEHPASLPKADIPESTDCLAVIRSSLQKFTNLQPSDLAPNAIWRDSCALTGTLRTFYSPSIVSRNWTTLSSQCSPHDFKVVEKTCHIIRLGPTTSWIEGNFTFSTSSGVLPARCSGRVGVVPDGHGGEWKIWLLCTILEQPDGFPDVDHIIPSPAPSPDLRDLDCIVVGAAVGGLCMAARLHALGLSYVVLEKHPAPGENWIKERYDSVRLHTSKAYNQLPGQPPTWDSSHPYLLSGHDVADGFARFTKTFGINVLTSTTLQSATYDRKEKIWTLHATSTSPSFSPTLTPVLQRLRARHLVLAVGNKGTVPLQPSYANQHLYRGDIIHAGCWKSGTPWKRKRGIVIGSANSTHDVISDMARADFSSITLVQRSKTWVLPGSTFGALVDPVYNDSTPLEVSDRVLLSYPLPIQRLMAMAGIRGCAEQQPEYFDAFEGAGFKTERFGDLWGLIYDREGGHFFDVGAGELIRDGSVRVVSDALPMEWTERGLMFSDGREEEADVVVFATGYQGNIKSAASKLLGEEVGSGLQEFWGCDEEGEVRGAWRETGHPALWYTGHGFAHARYYARFVAMRIKAEIERDKKSEGDGGEANGNGMRSS